MRLQKFNEMISTNRVRTPPKTEKQLSQFNNQEHAQKNTYIKSSQLTWMFPNMTVKFKEQNIPAVQAFFLNAKRDNLNNLITAKCNLH